MNPVVHFEMPYEDKDRMSGFYGKAFGWKPQMLGPDMGNYVVMTTTEIDEKTHMPKEPGRINGGFFKKNKPEQVPSVVIAVDNMSEAIQKVKDAGGTIHGGSKGDGNPDEIPGVGTYCSFTDTEGNRLSMLQPAPMMETRPQ